MSGDWRSRAAERKAAAEAGKERALAVVSRVEQFLGTTSSQKEATKRLAQIAKECHLISPARVCSSLPEGTGVDFSMVLIDTTPEVETYPQNGKLAILKPGLLRIMHGAGVKPDPALCRRTDDGKDARYYSFQAVGYLTQFDGTEIPLSAHKEVDLRPDSPMVQALTAECVKKAVDDWRDAKAAGKPPKDPLLVGVTTKNGAEEVGLDHAENRVRNLQLHAMAQCDSKALLRMIRCLGIRQAYTAAELEIPFVTARLTYTGRFSDPDMQREANRRTMDRFAGGRQLAYGTPPGAPTIIDVPASNVRVSSKPERDDEEPPDPPATPRQEAQDEAPPDATEDPAPAENAQPATPGEAGQASAGPGEDPDAPKGDLPFGDDAPPMEWKGKPFMIPLGKGKAPIPVRDCKDPEQLRYWIDRLTKELDAGVEKKFEAYSIAKLEAFEYVASRLAPW